MKDHTKERKCIEGTDREEVKLTNCNNLFGKVNEIFGMYGKQKEQKFKLLLTNC